MNKYMVTLYIRTIEIIKTGPGNLQSKRINNNGNRIFITKSTDNDCVQSKKKLAGLLDKLYQQTVESV